MGAERRATYADLEAVPEHLVAEILDGELLTHPRPTLRHGVAATSIAGALTGPFQRGEDGPGGWVFVVEPELHLAGHVLVPDIAAWRSEHAGFLAHAAFAERSPDWICEVLSPSTQKRDRTIKRRIYAEVGVPHLWHLDPVFQTLETYLFRDGSWVVGRTWNSADDVRAAPFDAISFPLSDLWPFDRPLGFDESPQASLIGDR